ncbi:hypothetical protein ACGVWS_14720 [Enterobacteriaceae bacterium LUAb1]
MSSPITKILSTQKAAKTDLNAVPNLKPFNIITVYGVPGKSFMASTAGNIFIHDGNVPNRREKHYQIGSDNSAQFSVYYTGTQSSTLTAENYTDIVSIIPDEPDEIYQQTVNVTFGNYYQSDAAEVFTAYNYTTDAPADGVTHCSVYLQTDASLLNIHNGMKSIRVNVNNGAVIDGYDEHATYADIPVRDDGTTVINITSTTPGQVIVKLNAPYSQAPDDSTHFTISFIDVSGVV